MIVEFYQNFSKKFNSTKRPAGESVQYDCILKRECSVYNPVFQLNVGLTESMASYNYMWVDVFHRYYYVSWNFADGLWEAVGRCDVMATYRPKIGAANLYLARAANTFNTTIEDTLFPTMTQIQYENERVATPWLTYNGQSLGSAGGTFIIGIIGNGNSGGVTYYGMPRLFFNQFMQHLLTDVDWTDIEWEDVIGLGEEIWKTLVDPMQYIVSAKWFPIDITGRGMDIVDEIPFGMWTIKSPAYIMTAVAEQINVGDFRFPDHPGAKNRADYLRFAPYSRYYLQSAPFGTIELQRIKYRSNGDDHVEVNILLDWISGSAEMRFLRDGTIIDTALGKLSVDVPLLQMTIDLLGAITTVTGTAAGIAGNTQKYLTQSVQNIKDPGSGLLAGPVMVTNQLDTIATGISNFANNITPHPTVIKGNPTYSDFIQDYIEFYGVFLLVTDENKEQLGKPLMSTRNVASLGGYMLPMKCDIEIDGTDSENLEVRHIMSGGFYYE